MIHITCRIPKQDAENAFQTIWSNEKFKGTAEELLHDLTKQLEEETKKAQDELGMKLEDAKIRRSFVEALFKVNTLGTINVDLREKLKDIAMVFSDKIGFEPNGITYEISAINASDMTDYRRLNLNEFKEIEKSLSWTARAAIRAQGGLRSFMERIFKSQKKIGELYEEELRALFPHAGIEVEVNRK